MVFLLHKDVNLLAKRQLSLRIISVGIICFILFFSLSGFAITISVQAPKCQNSNEIQSLLTSFSVPKKSGFTCCEKVVGLGLRDQEKKKLGGSGRSYSKSGLTPGVNYGFGFGQGHSWSYKKVGCGRFVINHNASVLLLCKRKAAQAIKENKKIKTQCRAFIKYDD